MSTSAPPFGLILPSRAVLTSPIVLSATQYAFTFPSSPSFSHVVVFLLPEVTIPQETLAGVYVQLPDPRTTASEFRLMGAIGNEKPSAIFRVDNYRGESIDSQNMGGTEMEDEMTDVDGTAAAAGLNGSGIPNDATITIGISIEPAANIAGQLEVLKASMQPSATSTALISSQRQNRNASPITTKVLAQKIIKNAFNFLASFGEDKVPLKSFQDWWTKFERRIENDPGFLERVEQE